MRVIDRNLHHTARGWSSTRLPFPAPPFTTTPYPHIPQLNRQNIPQLLSTPRTMAYPAAHCSAEAKFPCHNRRLYLNNPSQLIRGTTKCSSKHPFIFPNAGAPNPLRGVPTTSPSYSNSTVTLDCARCNNPEYHDMSLHCCKNLKYQVCMFADHEDRQVSARADNQKRQGCCPTHC